MDDKNKNCNCIRLHNCCLFKLALCLLLYDSSLKEETESRCIISTFVYSDCNGIYLVQLFANLRKIWRDYSAQFWSFNVSNGLQDDSLLSYQSTYWFISDEILVFS